MAISCVCPSCSANFKVKDEYAGKKAKCPKCGEPMVIPSAFNAEDTVKVPPPAAKTAPRAVARPVKQAEVEEEEAPRLAKRPRVADDEEAPSKRKRRRESDDDAPDGKTRRASDDEDEGRPKKKRRREEPKKASNLPLLLGIGMLVLLVLVGGGIIAAVMLSKSAGPTTAINSDRSGPLMLPGTPTGQSPIGVPNPAELEPELEVTAVDLHDETQANIERAKAKYDGKVVKLTGVGVTSSTHAEVYLLADRAPVANGNKAILICYLALDQRGKLTLTDGVAGAVVGKVNFTGVGKQVQLLTSRVVSGGVPWKPLIATLPNTGSGTSSTPVATLTASELAKDHTKYAGKWVVVTGKVKAGMDSLRDKREEPKWEFVELEQEGVRVSFTGLKRVWFAYIHAREQVQIWGKVAGLSADQKSVLVEQCLRYDTSAEFDVTSLLNEFKDYSKGSEKYKDKTFKVTGVVRTLAGKKVLQADPSQGEANVRLENIVTGQNLLDELGLNLRNGDKVTFVGVANDYSQGKVRGVGDPEGLIGQNVRILSVTRSR